MPAAPASATPAPIRPTILSDVGSPPNAPSPTTATATSSISPTYSAVFAPTDSGVGPEALLADDPTGVTVVEAPTPNANEPAVTWPSVLEATRQLTV